MYKSNDWTGADEAEYQDYRCEALYDAFNNMSDETLSTLLNLLPVSPESMMYKDWNEYSLHVILYLTQLQWLKRKERLLSVGASRK